MLTTAVVFPGQGSQSVGMLVELAENNPIIRTLFSEVSNRLSFDLWDLVQNGPESKLNQTENTQVAMLVADVAVYRLLEQRNMPKPLMMAGHSLGEYAALVAANALTLADAALLVQTRGQLMQRTVPLGHGAMAAIVGLADEVVQSLCLEISTDSLMVSPANYNAIGQVVIAGHTKAVEAAIKLAEQMGARMAVMIPVSVPCHCSLLKEAAFQFADTLARVDFRVPELPVISNVDLSIYESTDQIKALLSEQLYRPVRWVETVQLMKHRGIQRVIECGPAKVLSGLLKRIDKSFQGISVNDEASVELALSQ